MNPTDSIELGRQPAAANSLRWLWPGYLARGTVAVLDGDPGVGKSILTLDLAARLTRGGAWPDDTPVEKPSFVTIYAAEDSRQQVVLPRLKTADADLRMLDVVGTPDLDSDIEFPCFPKDLPTIGECYGGDWPDLLVFDPLTYFINGPAPVIRSVMGGLSALAANFDVTILLVRHLIKESRMKAMYRGQGSIGIIGAARTAFLAAHDPTNPSRCVLTPTKSNLGPLPPALTYRIIDVNGVGRLEWLGPTNTSADSAARGPQSESAERPGALMAADWLVKVLENGELPAATVLERAKAAGITERTLDRAKAMLRIKSSLVPTGRSAHVDVEIAGAAGGRQSSRLEST